MSLTLPLNSSWDIFLNPNGNLQLTDQDSSIAQDVASAIKTFEGECWYNTTLGMPYFQSIFGKEPPSSFVVANIRTQAATIDNVTSVNVVGVGLKNRNLKGVVVLNAPSNPITVVL